ncbi:MAG TPA: hypothetical protein VGM88_32145 [Kofleriaceae bacterium]|jgi:hypothetical protein
MRALLILVALAAIPEHRAHAIAACAGRSGWGLAEGTVFPPKPRVIYFAPDWEAESLKKRTPSAAIDGKPVPVKVSWEVIAPDTVAVFAVDSSATGVLEVGWAADKATGTYATLGRYTIAAGKDPTEAHGTISRFHQAYHHSTVHEVADGLRVTVDVTATRFVARVRRDAKSPWQEIPIVAHTADGKSVAQLGELGCVQNFSVPILEAGIDLELTAELADGAKLPVKGLPAHVVLPPLPPGAEKSSP